MGRKALECVSMFLKKPSIGLWLATALSMLSVGIGAEPLALEIGEGSPGCPPVVDGAAFSPDGQFALVGIDDRDQIGLDSKIVVYRTADGSIVREVPWPRWPRTIRARHVVARGGREWTYLQSGELLTLAADGWGYLTWDRSFPNWS